MRRLVALSLLWLVACGTNPGPKPPDPPEPSAYQFTVVVKEDAGPFVPNARLVVDDSQKDTTNENGFADTTLPKGLYRVRLEADGFKPSGFVLELTRHLHTDVTLTRDHPPQSSLRVEGRFFVTDWGTYRGRWTSGLTLLARPPPERATFLDWAARTGFDGVRVFAGDLGWAGQTPQSALANLPALLTEMGRRGLVLHLVAITGSASGYDVEAYLRQIQQVCHPTSACILEVANEIGHSSQSSVVNDPRQLEQIAQRVIPSGQVWTLGAMLGQDEPINGVYPPTGVNPFSTAHLDRSRDKWNQVRRVREIAAISEATGKPAISGEPIGAAEFSEPGRRESDPAFFFAYGALCRLFELGSCVFHSEDGLASKPLRPIQQQCADDFLAGFKSIDSDARLGYRNAGWTGSDVPVASFTGAVRVYSGVTGNDGYTVAVGVEDGFSVEWKNGYHVVAELGRRPGVVVWKIAK